MAQPVVKPQELNPLLARYLQSLATRPLLTKACTAGTLSLLQEVIAGQITGAKASFKPSGNPALDVVQANQRALKMGAYGFFVSAPLGHTLLGVLTKLFEGKTSAKARIAQILCSNIFISPIQQSVCAYMSTAYTIVNDLDKTCSAWDISMEPKALIRQWPT
ncbi:hypothetical protein BT69DRAFT_1284693 [Atractiella rhizophila]|nr:hypothetical protein BT69DRAFT_1284693 [Atractiella rhizophila]